MPGRGEKGQKGRGKRDGWGEGAYVRYGAVREKQEKLFSSLFPWGKGTKKGDGWTGDIRH